MKSNSKSKAEKYLESRDRFRIEAQNDFLTWHKDSNLLVASTNELVASLSLFLSGKDLRQIDHGMYKGKLIVSFCRSHFIACDLILGGELVEAVTIMRKQMELLSRLHELTAGLKIEQLERKTPNLKHLKTSLKKLYSDYSEIAHSASPKVMALLGNHEIGTKSFAPLYPQFQNNSTTAMQHLAVSALEFYYWISPFYKTHFPEYDSKNDEALVGLLRTTHKRIFPRK